MKGFLSNLYLRPSCHDCKCKDGKHHSDISLGDFWGIDKFNPSFDDDKGVSLVLINTPKGKEFLQKVKMEKWESSYALVSRANGGFSPYAWLNPKRSLFFKLIWQGATVRQAHTSVSKGDTQGEDADEGCRKASLRRCWRKGGKESVGEMM